MTEPTRKPRAKTRVKHLGPVKASLVAVSMALTVGGWAVLARDDSLTLSQSVAQVGIEQSAPPTISAPPPPTATPVPFRATRRDERAGRPTVQAQPKEQKDEDDERGETGEKERTTPRTAPTQVPTQPAPQPTPLPTQPTPTQRAPLLTQPPAQNPPSVAPRQPVPPAAPQPRARTRSSR